MRNTLAVLHGAELHGGRDLDHAYRCSKLDGDAPAARAPYLAGVFGAVGGLVTDAGNADLSKLRVQSRIVRGTETVSGAAMNVLFRGRSKTLEFAARHILGSEDFVRCKASARPAGGCDVLVTDHPLLDGGAWALRPAIRVCHWLRQRSELRGTWPETLECLPASLKKELRRWLGKRDYRARIVSDLPAKLEFYERYLLPQVKQRFGAAAVVPNRRTYRGEADVSVLFELRAADEFLGASLLKRDGDTLFIGRTAFSPAQVVPSEILDFFCLVLAQRLGCRWLDLGLTRPQLDDGVLLYKAKWRPRLVPPGALKSAIRIRPLRASAATLGFLSRNGFIERRAGRYVVRRLRMAGEPGVEALGEISALAERAGVDEMLVAFPGATERAAAAPKRTRLCALGSRNDALEAFLRLP